MKLPEFTLALAGMIAMVYGMAWLAVKLVGPYLVEYLNLVQNLLT